MAEIGRLTAVFDADTHKLDSSLKASEERIKSLRANIASIKTDDIGGKSERISALRTILDKALADHKALRASQKATAQSAKEMSRDIENALSTISPRLGSFIGLAGPLTLLAAGLTANAAAVIALGAGLFEITKSASEFGSKIHDVAQETGSTAETISTLAYAAKLSGKTLDDVQPAIKKFEVTVGDAAKGSKEATKALIRLGIDPKKAITDLDGSLAKAFKTIHAAGGGIAQVNLAADAFGKRAGPNMISVVETAGGDFAKFQAHAKELGVVLSTDAANAADEFGDKLDEVTERVKFLGIQFGLNLAPQVLEALNTIDRAISDLPKTIAVTTALTQSLIETEVIGPLRIVEGVLNALEHPHSIPVHVLFSGPPALMAYFLGQGAAPVQNVGIDVGLPNFPKKTPAYGGGGGGKGGGEDPAKTAQRIAKLQLDAVIAGLKAEQDANKRSLDLRRQDFNDYATQYMAIETRRHDAVIAGLDREKKAAEKLKKGREVALQEIQNKRVEENTTHEENRNKVLDERGKIVDQINKFLRDQDREIGKLTNSTDQWDQAYQDLVDTLKEEGVTLEENTRIRIESNNELARERELVLSVTRARRVLQSIRERVVTRSERDRPPWIDLGGGSTVGGEPATTERPRIATVDEQVTRERLAKIREQMHQLARDLTDIFSQSISDGFNNGIKSGLQTLAQGLLRIVQEVFLRKMAEGLANMLSNIAGGQGSGGGFFGALLRGIVGGLGGGIGSIGSIGGIGTASAGGAGTVFAGAIGRDSGGPIWPNQLYKVHKDEYIVPTAPGFVIPKGMTSGRQTIVNNNYSIQLPPDSRGSYNSPRSKRQLSESLIAALEATRT